MPFNRPAIDDIYKRIQLEIDAAFPGADAALRRSVEGVVARCVAMASHEMYGFLEWIFRQINVTTCDVDILESLHATQWDIPRKAAAAATGAIQFSGTDGASVLAGAALRRADGALYTLGTDVTIAGGAGTGNVTADTAGQAGNTAAGVKLTLVSPIPGIVSEVSVAAGGLFGGSDIEDAEDLRGRILERIQNPPHGGSAADYVMWAKEVAGVTRAWPYPNQYGLGTVGLTFVMDGREDTPIPSAGDVSAVQAYIGEVRQVGADLTVFAPTAVPVDFVIHLTPNTASVRQAIMAEIADFFQREAEPGAPLYISRLREAISTATGEFDHVLVSPAANIVVGFGELPVVGTFTWDVI